MKYDTIEGIDKQLSRLILGNDNQTEYDSAAKVWDHWIEVGGNAFDNAFVYGDGIQEQLLGQWHNKRNNRKDIIIITKGAHTPDCNPKSLSEQLTISLERLRDNLDCPINEFIDVLNEEKEKGRIKIFGGSNWTIERFTEANKWAQKNNKQELSILNNNLSLAKMIKPLWQGCISSNNEFTLNYLTLSQKTHLSWSSQGRGYFLPDNIRQEIEDNISQVEASSRKPGENSSGPISCFDSSDNQERRKRAGKLALHHRVTANNIAAAWTMNQPFPSFALVGPRTTNEIDTTLPCLNIELSESDVKWLNLQEEKSIV